MKNNIIKQSVLHIVAWIVGSLILSYIAFAIDGIIDLISRPFVSLLCGAFITWSSSYLYYFKAGNDLKKRANKILKWTDLVIRGMEQNKLIKVNRDKDGEPIGLHIYLKANMAAKSSTSDISVDLQ
jgi:hypothetical protein